MNHSMCACIMPRRISSDIYNSTYFKLSSVDGNFKKTFSSVFDPIENISVPLNYAWKTAKNLNYVKGTDGYRQSFQRVS